MDQVGVYELFENLRAIKVSTSAREFIDSAYSVFKKRDLPIGTVNELRRIARRYRRKIDELEKAREAARRSIWMKKNGINKSDVSRIVQKRLSEERAEKSDLGI